MLFQNLQSLGLEVFLLEIIIMKMKITQWLKDDQDKSLLMTSIFFMNLVFLFTGLFPMFEASAMSLIIGFALIASYTRINDENLAQILGKKIGAIFSKNNVIALISMCFLTVLNVSLITIYRINQS